MPKTNILCRTKKILIVDDDPAIIQMLTCFLEDKGYFVSTACDGERAFEKIYMEMPDLVLLDLTLPKMPGEMVCKKTRACEKIKNIPIIMVSGKSSDADKVICRVIGANHYVTKPVDLEKLLGLISDIFNSSSSDEEHN